MLNNMYLRIILFLMILCTDTLRVLGREDIVQLREKKFRD